MRKILLVRDMQNDFIDGALGTKEAVAIVPKVVDEIKKYNSSDIFLTADTHFENYLETQEGKNLPVPHCIEGSSGWQLHPLIDELFRNGAGDPRRRVSAHDGGGSPPARHGAHPVPRDREHGARSHQARRSALCERLTGGCVIV